MKKILSCVSMILITSLNGKRYFYLLEDIDTNGISTFHGPVKAVPRRWYGVGR